MRRKALELSPAAVTKSMRELEAQVGVALIVREASRITLSARYWRTRVCCSGSCDARKTRWIAFPARVESG